jgi:tRNA(fMet)-specific endonuclease VapC
MLADTTFLIDLMVHKAPAVDKAKELEEKGITILVGAPSIFELYVGAAQSKKSEEERLKIVSTVASLPQLTLDYESAKAAGEIFVNKTRAGATIDAEDAMLAGIARVQGQPIITRNVRHFSKIDGVVVESY